MAIESTPALRRNKITLKRYLISAHIVLMKEGYSQIVRSRQTSDKERSDDRCFHNDIYISLSLSLLPSPAPRLYARAEQLSAVSCKFRCGCLSKSSCASIQTVRARRARLRKMSISVNLRILARDCRPCRLVTFETARRRRETNKIKLLYCINRLF